MSVEPGYPAVVKDAFLDDVEEDSMAGAALDDDIEMKSGSSNRGIGEVPESSIEDMAIQEDSMEYVVVEYEMEDVSPNIADELQSDRWYGEVIIGEEIADDVTVEWSWVKESERTGIAGASGKFTPVDRKGKNEDVRSVDVEVEVVDDIINTSKPNKAMEMLDSSESNILPSNKQLARDMCDYKRCSKPGNLEDRKTAHPRERPFACNICDFRCSHAANLKAHKRTHTREKPLACDMCDYRCTRTRLLLSHKSTHTGEKPFACDMCDHTFTSASSLKRHASNHTGEQPFVCDTCGYSSSQAGNLKVHIRTHTGEKPFACDMCDYSCTQSGTLKHHKSTHTGEKPYACGMCDYVCTRPTTLKRHKKRSHS